MKKVLLLALLFGSFITTTLAQESSCTNGTDDDGDGFIDCFDGDCATINPCNDSYTGNDKACQIPQPPGSAFQMLEKNVSNQYVTTTHGRFVVGDMNRDGIPEVVTAHASNKKVYILDGRNLNVLFSGDTEYAPDRYDITIGNINNDNCAEIFLSETHQPPRDNWWDDWPPKEFYISSYNCQGVHLWSTKVHERAFTMGLADFDADGKAEIYFRNQILDASTGMSLVAGSGNWQAIDGGPVAVDILDAYAGLELVLGGEIYSVTLPTTRNAADANTGTITLRKSFNTMPGLSNNVKYFPKAIDLGGDKFVNSQTSIADFDLDGKLDVLMTGASKNSTGSPATVFYWNVDKNTYKTYQPLQDDDDDWPYGCGRLNVADIDGNGKMNVAFVSGSRLFVLDENLNILMIPGTPAVEWIKEISEVSSGYTSTTVFDFNNDNAAEIVYRDEDFLYIFNGKTGAASPAIACGSLTSNDYPVVVDVDADGSTEICVVCQAAGTSSSNSGVIRTYKSALEPWVSARKVWNQHGYFNVNVNDDLTIPKVQQKHHLIFSTDICPAPKPGDPPIHNRALNSFLNQSAILDSKGCKTYASADVEFVPSPQNINITAPTCPEQDFKVSFTLKNSGDLTLNGTLPITFYSGDPTQAGAVKLNTVNIPLNNFVKGATIARTDITVNGTGKNFTLFAVLNDAGTTLPLELPNTTMTECNYDNNMVSAQVNPATFPLNTASTDHVQCLGTTAAPNGTAEAYKLDGTNKVTVGYKFYWFSGSTVGDTTAAVAAGDIGATRSPLANGTYSVVAYHKAYRCASAPAIVNVGLTERDVSATISINHDYTNCNAPDGQLTVVPDGGLPISNFTYAWYEGTGTGTGTQLSITNVLTGASGLTYSVFVKETSSGCTTLESETVPNQTSQFTVSATSTLANCNPLNSGTATASVGGVTAGYEFRWYDGSTVKALPDFTGVTYSSLTAGNYTVVAKELATGCSSAPFIQPVGSVSGVSVSIGTPTPQTACVGKNGAALATVTGGAATFQWFMGSNTLPANEVLPAPGANLTGAAAGTYTVLATNNATGCADTEEVTIVDNIVYPSITTTTTPQTNCAPANGSVAINPATATNGPHIYFWFDGNVGTPDTTAAGGQVDHKGATYAGRTAGTYTVVAVNKNTGCPSPAVPATVANNTVPITVTPVPVHNTSCNPASPNGGASANVGGTTAGYKFRWFTGGDTTSLIVQNATVANSAPGTYTVKAVSLTTGCFDTEVFSVNNNSAKPVLSLTKTDNTVCTAAAGYTGSVTSSFSSNPNSQPSHTYTYAWTKNGTAIGGTASSQTALNAGTYAVRVTNVALGCTSDPASIAVADTPTLPALTIASTGSTNCLPVTDVSKINGSAQLTFVDGNPIASVTGYTFQWHTGAGTTSPISVATNPTANTPKLEKVQGSATSNFTVRVTRTATGCVNTATVLVADASVKPVLTLENTPNSICNPTIAGTPNDGTASRDGYSYAGTYTGTQTLVYAWYNGQTTATPHTPATTTDNIGNLPAGFYSATVTIDELGCTSALATTEVKDVVALPVIETLATPSTNCQMGATFENGSAEVTEINNVVVPASTTAYTFRWFDGSNAGGAVQSTAIKYDKVQGGATNNYTVEVTQKSNGCVNTATVLVTDGSVKPALTLKNTPNSICDDVIAMTSKNGTASRDGYTYNNPLYSGPQTLVYAWYDGQTAGSPHLPATTTDNIGNLAAGFYSATVTISELGCTSALATTEVEDDVDLPVIETKATPSTNCQMGVTFENGSAEVTEINNVVVPASTTAYTFAWYDGASATGAVQSTAIKYDNVQGGATNNYTVEVTQKSNGCKNTATVLVTDGSVKPVLTLKNTPNSICDDVIAMTSKNGTASRDGYTYNNPLYTGSQTLVYAWYDGQTTGLPHSPATTTDNISNLQAGFYSATVTISELGCTSALATTEVEDDVDLPVIETLATPSTNCTMGTGLENGAAEVTEVNNNVITAATTVYTFEWFNGTSATGGVQATTFRYEDLQGGPTSNFTVEVTDRSNGCKNTATVLVTDGSVKPVLTLKMTPNTICDPTVTGVPNNAYDGTASVDAVTYTGAFTGGTYNYKWYDGQSTAIAHTAPVTATGIDELEANFYSATVEIIELGCVSNLASVEVEDDFKLPAITLTPTAATNCAGGTENGSATSTITNFVVGETFSYEWHKGSIAVPAFTTTQNISGQEGAVTYVLEAMINQTGCVNNASVVIPNTSQKPVLNALTHVDNTHCTTPNGSAAINATAFTYRTATPGAPYTGFTFLWSDGSTGTSIAGKAANTYTLQVTADAGNTVTNNDDNCISDPVSVTIVDDLDYPVVATNIMNEQTACPGFPTTGQIEATATGTVGGFIFEWFGGVGTGGAPVAQVGGFPGRTVQTLDEGDYTVRVTNANACASTVSLYLPANVVIPSISYSGVSPSTECGTGNGEAQASITGLTTFPGIDFELFYVETFVGGTAPTVPANVIASPTNTHSSTTSTSVPGLTGLAPGYITGVVRDNKTGCISDVATVQIQENTSAYALNITGTTQAGFCAPGNGGGINATILKDGAPCGGCTFEWYLGTPSNTNPDINFYNNPPDMTSATFIQNDEDLGLPGGSVPGGVGAGTYTLVVEDPSNSCGNYFIQSVDLASSPSILVDTVNVTRCVNPNGEVNVIVNGPAVQGYEIKIFRGNSAAGTLVATTGAAPISNPGGNIPLSALNQLSGNYFVQVIDHTPANLACPLGKVWKLDQKAFVPLVDIDAVVGNTACDDAGSADGQVSLTVRKDSRDSATPNGYQITNINPLPLGFTAPLSTPIGVGVGPISGFRPLTYTITVAEATTGCTVDKLVTVPDQPVMPVLGQADVAVINDSFCAPESNGSITVTNISPANIADYDFTWYTNPALTAGSIVYTDGGGGGNGELLNHVKYAGWLNATPGLGIGTREYYVRGVRQAGTGTGVGCPTPAVKVVVQDEHVTPVPVLSSTPNTSCTPAFGEGSISIETTTASPDATVQNSPYTYSIMPAVSAPLTNRSGALFKHYTGLNHNAGAPYAVTVMNEENACQTTRNISVLDTKYTLAITKHTFADKLVCNLDGEIAATEVTIDRSLTSLSAEVFDGTTATTIAAGFEFRWFKGTPGTFTAGTPLEDDSGVPVVIPGPTLNVGTGAGNYPDVPATGGAGTYYVVARRQPAAGVFGANCETTPLRVDILDKSELPQITLTPFSNTSCDPAALEGEIDVDVTDSSPITPPPGGFTFSYGWATSGPALPTGGGPAYTGVNDHFDQLEEGTYTLTVTNNQTGCDFSAQTTIIENATPIFTQVIDIDPQLFCLNSGSLEVKSVSYEDRAGTLISAPLADFEFTWLRGAAVVGTTDPKLDSSTYGGINADANYFVVAKRTANGPGFGCESAPLRLEITDESQIPDVTLAPLSNTSCLPAASEGEITVDVSDNSPFPTAVTTFTYAYNWTGSVATPTGGGPAYDGIGNRFITLPDGTYNLAVTNNQTGCVAFVNTTITKNTTPVFVQNVDIDAQLFCLNSGSLEVETVTYADRSGAIQNAPLGDFSFTWFRGGTAVGNVVGNNATLLDSANYTGINADDDYYVVARRMANFPGRDCESAPMRLEIKDESKDPDVVLSPLSNTSCDLTVFEGEIKVDVTDSSPFPPTVTAFNYAYNWVTPPTVPVGGGGPPYDGAGNNFTGLKDGTYNLEVTNNQTGCVGLGQTIIIKNSTPIFTQVIDIDPQLFCFNSGSLEVKNVSYEDRAGVLQTAPLADFEFTWSRGAAVVGNANPLLDSMSYAGISADANYFVVAKRVANGPGLECESAPVRLEIKDESQTPDIVLTPFSNTSCDPAASEGEITVDVTDQSAFPTAVTAFTYSYDWTGSVATPTGGGPAYSGGSDHFNGLLHGIYTLEVTNNQTGCSFNAQTEVVENTTPIFVQDVDPDAQLFCVASGSLEVRQIRFVDRAGTTQSINAAGLVDFSFEWFKDGTALANRVGGTASLLDSAAYIAIGADPDYYVVATRNANGPGRGCSSAPFKVEIPDEREYPVITLSTMPNTVCDTNYLGSIEVDIDDDSKVPGTYTYDYTWTSTTPLAAPPVTNPYSGANNIFSNLQHATYELVAFNRESECTSVPVQAVIQQILPTVEILAVDKIDQTDCLPVNGSIAIDGTSATHMSLPAIATETYSFTWTRNGAAYATPTPSNILDPLNAATYTVTGTKTGGVGSGCVTQPFPVVIEDKTKLPAINLSSVANYACVAPFNGSISATVTEGTTTGTTGYDYEWFSGLNNTTNIIAVPLTDAGITARQQGDYTVRVTDTDGLNEGCVNIATLPVLFMPTDLSSNILATVQTKCAPIQNGQLEVQKITEIRNGASTTYDMANAGQKGLFAFQWFDDAQAPLTAVVSGTAGGNVLPAREAGEYFVQITNSVGCTSLFSRALVEDKNSYPAISLDHFVNPKLCVMPDGPGEMRISADGSFDTNLYRFRWFEGADTTSTQVLANNPNLENIFYNDPQEYTVKVTNLDTRCYSLETYKFATDTLDIRVMASGVPLSNCLVNNGTLFAATVEGNANIYNYEWYAGTTVGGTPQFTDKEVTNAPMGIYTVIARNPNHSFCVSIPATTEVTDGRIYPPVAIEQKNPLTYCDPARPNGVAKATVNGTIVGYSFDWFLGPDASGTSFYNGSEVDGLRAVTYTAQATDITTGCVGTKSIVIDNVPVKVPSPSVVILSHLTRCVPPPDGALQANVNGNTVDYTIQWYNGATKGAVPDATGEFYRQLDQGSYTTTATDVVSGCVSEPVITQVLPFMKNPEFEIKTVPTHCEANVGQAEFTLLNDVQLKSLEWIIGSDVQTGSIVSGLAKGTYTIVVTTEQDCKVSQDFEILPEILVFNGISQNGDGQNDFFEISCIGDFPNNTVKIFNRAGTLVYQGRGYNNSDIIFSGTSNEGLSLMGRELPEGTYFYIIDKGNGSKPKTGYLELLRK